MYSFEPNEEQKMLVEAINRYATSDLRAAAHDADEEGCLKQPLVEKGWELGFLQASIPEAYGGFGERSVLTGVLAAEEMAYGDLAGALAVMAPGLFAFPILLGGSEAQKQAYLPPLVEAEWQPYTAALIEPQFDFDPQDLRTEAIQSNGGYILQGEKAFVPFAAEAPAMLVYARLDGQTQGFIVPRLSEGMQVIERQSTLGIRGLPLYRVKFDQVRVPA